MFNSNLSLFAKTLTLTSALFFLSSCAQEEPVYEAPQQSNTLAQDTPVTKPTSRSSVSFKDLTGLVSDDGKFNYSELSQIADSHEYFLRPSNNPYAHEIEYSVGDYRDNSKSGNLVGSMLVRVWNIYSIPKRTNYYLIHIESQTLFSGAYKGVYNKAVETDGWYTIAKVAEWYGRQVKIDITPSKGSFYAETHYPNTTAGSKTYSHSIGSTMGACVGYKGEDFNCELRPSLTITDSQSYSVNDVSVSDFSKADNLLSWVFYINNEPDTSFHPFYVAGTDMSEPCATATSSLNARADAVIAFPYDASTPPRLTVSYQVGLASRCGKAGLVCGARMSYFPKNGMENLVIDLPYITPEQAEAAQKKAK